jgi:dTDP-L-rhamnose 4-epimerase
MAHILITGGAGFIGTHLTRLALSDRHRVRILDNLSRQIHGDGASFVPAPGSEFVYGDVNDRSDLERALAGVDTVVHLAAETGTGQSMYEIERYYRVNVQGTALLFDILTNSEHSVRSFILASSRSVYGEGAYVCRNCDAAGARRFPSARTATQLAAHQWTSPCPVCDGPIDPTATREDDPVAPASIYAATKLAQEELVRVACSSLGILYTILRFQNVFGEGQSLSNPYTGILHCIETPTQEGVTLNVGSGTPASIMSIAQLLRRSMNSDIEPHVTGQYRVGDIRHNFADISRLESVIGFKPNIPLEAGLKRFAQWVATQPLAQDLLDKANAELKARKLMA